MNHSTELLKHYKSYLVLKNYAVSTINLYTTALKYFFKFCEDQRFNEPLNHDQVRQYLLYRRDNDCSWTLINTQYSGLKIFFINIFH